LLREDTARTAVNATERFMKREIDRKAFLQVRKAAIKRYCPVPKLDPETGTWKPEIKWDTQEKLGEIARWVMQTPFKQRGLYNLGERVSSVMVASSGRVSPATGWVARNHPVFLECLQLLANQAVQFANVADQNVIEERQTSHPDSLDDSRFQHPFLKFDGLREWISLHMHDAGQRHEAIAALNAFVWCQHKKKISANDVRPIIAAATMAHRPIREKAIEMLMLIGRWFAAGRNGLLAVLAHVRNEVRFSVVTLVQYWRLPFPKPFVRRFFERALADKAARVRVFAAEGIDGYDREDLLPTLEAAITKERDRKTRDSLRYSLCMLRDGYYVDRSLGRPFLHVKNGGAVELRARN
jgi:hypothetical protein